jgi:hypothetical protein
MPDNNLRLQLEIAAVGGTARSFFFEAAMQF